MERNEEVLERIVEELVEGGYDRALISSLSPFDKLTGGLAWCITASNVDVDFDLLYAGDATLYDKLKAGEAIEVALQKIKCPHPLQAHQIQGLDYPAIYPVVQWLVKRVITTQEMLGGQFRRVSRWCLNNKYGLTEERESESRHGGNVANTGVMKQWPQHVCQLANDSDSTIGHHSEAAHVVTPQNVQLTGTETFDKQQTAAPWKRIANVENANHLLQQEMENLKAHISKTEEYRESQREQEAELLLKITKLNEMVEKEEATNLLERLMPCVEQHKMQEDNELSFHSSCEKKHVELLECIQDLKNEADKDICNHKSEVENTLQQDCRKLENLRRDLAKRNQNFLLYRRKLDELPCQSELMQYERCFVELYTHIQSKLQETRKYFASYNALAEANEFTVKEISLLNSINKQFEEVMMSNDGRTKFVASMNDIAKGVHQKVVKMEAKFHEERNTLAELEERHSRLVAERRQYASLMKLFQEECTRNEALRSSVVLPAV